MRIRAFSKKKTEIALKKGSRCGKEMALIEFINELHKLDSNHKGKQYYPPE